MLSEILNNKVFLYRTYILISIIAMVFALILIRNIKEKTQNYSDPMVNTILEILYIYLIFIGLDYIFRIANFLWMDNIYAQFKSDWINRDILKLFDIDNLIKLCKISIISLYRGMCYTFIGCQIYILCKIVYLMIRFKYYFFLNRNYLITDLQMIPNTDLWTGRMIKTYCPPRLFEPILKDISKYFKEEKKYFNSIFEEIISKKDGVFFEEDKELYITTVEAHQATLGFLHSIFTFEIDLYRKRILKIAQTSLSDLEDKQIEYQNCMKKFAKEFNKCYGNSKSEKFIQIITKLREIGYLD